MSFPLGIVFGLVAMLGYGLGNAISKVPVKAIGGTKTVFVTGLKVFSYPQLVRLTR